MKYKEGNCVDDGRTEVIIILANSVTFLEVWTWAAFYTVVVSSIQLLFEFVMQLLEENDKPSYRAGMLIWTFVSVLKI